MLTLDDRFEAIVADVVPEAKMSPYQDPKPKVPAPASEPDGDAPAEEEPKEEEK